MVLRRVECFRCYSLGCLENAILPKSRVTVNNKMLTYTSYAALT